MSHSQANQPRRRRPLRPPSAFLPQDGAPASVPEAICLLVQALTQRINVDSEGEIGAGEERRVLSGGDIAAGVRFLLASERGRACLVEGLQWSVVPQIERELPLIGDAFRRIQEQQT